MKGDASALLQGLPITDANYTIAVSHLKEKYGNQQLLYSQLLNQLAAIPASDNSTAKLRSTYDKFEAILRAFEFCDELDPGSTVLPYMVRRKFPLDTLLQLSEAGAFFTLSKFRTSLKNLILLREQVVQQSATASSYFD